ncbi:MAG: SpoIIE family protein phosphatase [Planctomycetes bacterium]|nr:SpoIIE family protein phosphatase [Planctomycetota bacterium]
MPLPPSALLEIAHASEPPRRFELGAGKVRIGRARESEILVPEAHVSKAHAEICYEGDSFHVVDVGSRAGVLVNGHRVQRRPLADGDVIELGPESPVRLTFRASPRQQLAQEARVLTDVSGDMARGGMARLARFFEFSRKLGGGFTLEEVLQDVVDLAIDVTGAERGMLILQRDDESLETRVARAAGGRDLDREVVKASETLVRQTIETAKARIVADVADAIDLAQQASIMSLELRSAVTLPIVRATGETGAGAVFGVLYLDSRKRRGGFDGFDLGILERLAQDASSVIESARLLREAEEKRRIEREVATAREVQEALLPDEFSSTPVFEVAGVCEPCNELGGDYVDQFDLGDGRQALVVADVCGKGIAASLLAAALQGALAAEIAQDRPLGEIVQRVNRVHSRLAPVGKFITMLVALLEKDGTLRFVNAGHCTPLHVHGGRVVRPGPAGMALGLDEDAVYEAGEIRMAPGDAVVLYTDGVIECEGPGRELFGDERLEQLLLKGRIASAKQGLADVRDAVDAFRRGTPVSDDLSVLVVRRR